MRQLNDDDMVTIDGKFVMTAKEWTEQQAKKKPEELPVETNILRMICADREIDRLKEEWEKRIGEVPLPFNTMDYGIGENCLDLYKGHLRYCLEKGEERPVREYFKTLSKR